MEEEFHRKKYDYAANSNIVMNQDRSHRPKDAAATTGEGESLAGKITHSFGDRAVKGGHQELEDLKTAQRLREAEQQRKRELKQREGEMLMYAPKLRETKLIYQNIVQVVAKYLGDQPQSIVMGAVDEVLAVLKMDGLTDHQRKGEVEAMLTHVQDDDWNRLVVLARSLKDYRAEKAPEEGQFDQLDMNVLMEDEQPRMEQPDSD